MISHRAMELDEFSREINGVVASKAVESLANKGETPSAAPSIPTKSAVQSFQMARATRSRSGSSLTRRHEPRTVGCFHCDGQVKVSYAAKLATCPECGEEISLSDFEISKPVFEDVFTRGNITINKLGSIQADSVVCHNLKAYGTLTALVHATGDVMIRTRATLPRGLRCKRLMVGRDAHVTVEGEVFAEEMEIDGHITANGFLCEGTTKIDGHGAVNGPLKTKSVVMEEGGCLNGILEIVH